MSNAQSVIDALNAFYFDTSRSKQETAEGLEEIQDALDDFVNTIEDDLNGTTEANDEEDEAGCDFSSEDEEDL